MKQGDPLVSVVLATRNRAELLSKAITSVLGQSYKNIELIIVNDASADRTPQIIQEWEEQDKRVSHVRNDERSGRVRSANRGIRTARGAYVARIDDDDTWCDPSKLVKQVSFLESNPEYVLVGGGVIRVDRIEKELLRFLPPQQDRDIRKVMLQFNPFAQSAVVFRKAEWDLENGYDERLESSVSEDWDLWMRLGKKGKLHNFPEYFARCLEAGQNLSHQKFLHNARVTLALRLKYRNDYSNFLQGYLRGLISLLLAFLPFHFSIRRLFWRARQK
ncbi:MAG: glycosyltransferase family 2 protein [Candidatus Wildermuthbacteria bacterium]|nr:glycosyltransferase family 2 protein [Candidatus Wildermuthbacteria bacterium]